MAANLGREAGRAEVTLDLRALDQPGTLTAIDVVAGKAVPVSAGRLGLPLGPLEYAVFELKAQ